jgi:hypothetical protein
VIEDLANNVSAFTGAVSGFGGANHTNHWQFIDVSSVSFTSGQIHLNYTLAAGSGTLSVVSGATVVAQIKMIGRRTEGPSWFPTFRAPSRSSFGDRNPEALAGDVLLVKDPGHVAIDPGLSYVVATAVVGDLEDLLPDPSARKRRAGEIPDCWRASGTPRLARHPGAGADGPEAFTVDEAVADRFRSAVRRLAWVRLGANRRFRQKSNDFNAR